ncbi:hypothetical protein [Epinotia aporema granulovirus]|uniref:Uncharacterized protein n=1 Tax=Epinotia aporema granulovirus TaxID=166056 RepID=K4ERU9_9BBAC|nr:hypothetical protein [Epinotia aporema granulovirus]AER41515.1 hypothetical protein [Epinotia aporema granulovirus]
MMSNTEMAKIKVYIYTLDVILFFFLWSTKYFTILTDIVLNLINANNKMWFSVCVLVIISVYAHSAILCSAARFVHDVECVKLKVYF